MPSFPAYTIYAFGLTSLLAGLASLLSPDTVPPASTLPAACQPASAGNALAAIAMGLYYPLAAWQENRAFFRLSVCMRAVTSAVFFGLDGGAWGVWRTAAAWEGGGAAVTGLALLVER